MNPWLHLWEQDHLSQINLTGQWGSFTAGWSRGKSWIVLFQRVQEQHEVCRTNPGSIWRLLGFLGLPSGKSLHQKPSGNSTKREELLTLCQPHLSKKILLQPKKTYQICLFMEQQSEEALTVLFHSIFQFCPFVREQEVTPKQRGFLVELGFLLKLPSLSFDSS